VTSLLGKGVQTAKRNRKISKQAGKFCVRGHVSAASGSSPGVCSNLFISCSETGKSQKIVCSMVAARRRRVLGQRRGHGFESGSCLICLGQNTAQTISCVWLLQDHT
jgi:hypothetical protein